MMAPGSASMVILEVVCSAMTRGVPCWKTSEGASLSDGFLAWPPPPTQRAPGLSGNLRMQIVVSRNGRNHMREYSAPLTVEIPRSGNLTDDIVENGTSYPDVTAFSRKTASGWTGVTAAQFLAEVRATAKGLIAAGIEAGDRVALISKTRYEWTLLDYAIWFAGAVTVPIYETSSAEQIEWLSLIHISEPTSRTPISYAVFCLKKK